MRSLLLNLFFYSFTIVIALRVYWQGRRGDRPAMHRTLNYWGETVLRAVDVIMGGTVEVRGREHLETPGPVMFVSKHQSELDVVLLGKLMPNVNAVAMQELEKYPFFPTILRTLDLILVAVDHGPQNRTEQTVAGAKRGFDQGRSLMIYPEGTLMPLGARERYRRGVAQIYTRLGVTVVPVATSVGTIWPRREWRKHAGATGAIEFLAPIPPGLPFDRFMEMIEDRIETATMALIREHATGDMLAAAEARYTEAEAEAKARRAAARAQDAEPPATVGDDPSGSDPGAAKPGDPHVTVAEEAAAEGAAPKEAAPEGATPEGAAAEGATPEGAAPESAAPESAIPSEAGSTAADGAESPPAKVVGG
ncbi:MAG: 1-acyl-sn-glycerol-3-phosphate acyltransferase [Pseudomonadota bacterium]